MLSKYFQYQIHWIWRHLCLCTDARINGRGCGPFINRMKARNKKLHDVLEKFLSEALSPMSVEGLSALMSNFPPDLPELYFEQFTRTIAANCQAEFEKIIEEKNIIPKLDELDDLVAQRSGFEVSMKAFDFKPADPEVVKQSIVSKAKRVEIEHLQRILGKLREENAELEQRNDALKDRLSQAHEEIEATKRMFA